MEQKNSIKRLLCACEKDILKNKKNFYKNKGVPIDLTITRKKNVFSPVSYITDTDIKKLNPFLASIVSFNRINLEYFGKNFNVFYANKNTEKIDNVIEFFFDKNYKLDNWIFQYSESHTNALKLVCDFLGCTVNEVYNYEEANIIVGNISNYLEFVGSSTNPFELDVFPVLDKKMYIFYSGMIQEDEVSPGSYWFFTFLHQILHIFGLVHPARNNRSMPGTSFEVNNPGLFSMNNILTTLMSNLDNPVDFVFNGKIDWLGLHYPRTLMELDIQALKFMYNVEINIEYLKWIDYTCSPDVVQTIVSGTDGANLILQSDKNTFFNLSLDQFYANPGADQVCNQAVISRDAVSKFGVSMLDKNSFINKVFVSYPELNVYTSRFLKDTDIIVDSDNVKSIKVYISGEIKDYNYLEENRKYFLKKKYTNKRVFIDTNGYFVDVKFINCGYNLKEFVEEVKKEEKVVPEEDREVGKAIIENLQEEHYEEILDAFYNSNFGLEFKNLTDEELLEILNEYAVDYIANKFKNKLVGIPFPKMGDIIRKKSELKKK